MDQNSSSNFKKKKKKLAGIKSQMKHMSKEAVRTALLKKKKCNDRAIEIVNLLIEPNITEDILINCLSEINQSHFDDVIEERAILKVCSYPLCSNPLTNVPHKQFHISTKTNKVYDISERKNFCCNLCYKAGKYLKDQLYTSPLWLRDHEDHVTFKLLSLTNSGSSGEEIDLGHSHVTLEEPFRGSTTLKDESVEDDTCQQDKQSDMEATEVQAKQVKEERRLLEPDIELSSRLEAMDLDESDTRIEPKIKVAREVLPPVVTSEGYKSSAIKQSKVIQVKKASPKDVMIKIETVIRSWFSFETYCYILGETKVKQELECFGLEMQRQNTDPYLYDRYADLCKKLNLLELEETYGTKEVEAPKKPLPDFNKLKDESRKLEIKVNSFMRGELEFEVEEKPLNMPLLVEEQVMPVLPPLDHYATKATRRNIFLQKLCHSLPDIQEALGLGVINLSEQIKEFSTTLTLTAQNICLKPSEWNIVAIVLIKLLALRDDKLKEQLSSKKASHYLELILMSYTLDSSYLDRLLCWLLDMNYLVNSDLT